MQRVKRDLQICDSQVIEPVQEFTAYKEEERETSKKGYDDDDDDACTRGRKRGRVRMTSIYLFTVLNEASGVCTPGESSE